MVPQGNKGRYVGYCLVVSTLCKVFAMFTMTNVSLILLDNLNSLAAVEKKYFGTGTSWRHNRVPTYTLSGIHMWLREREQVVKIRMHENQPMPYLEIFYHWIPCLFLHPTVANTAVKGCNSCLPHAIFISIITFAVISVSHSHQASKTEALDLCQRRQY